MHPGAGALMQLIPQADVMIIHIADRQILKYRGRAYVAGFKGRGIYGNRLLGGTGLQLCLGRTSPLRV